MGVKVEDNATREATEVFMDRAGVEPERTHRKQKLGDRLFKVLKGTDFRRCGECLADFSSPVFNNGESVFSLQPKLVIALLDNEDLRALAHVEGEFPPMVLKEKAYVYHASTNASK